MAQEKMRWLEKKGDSSRENKRKGRSVEKVDGCQEKERKEGGCREYDRAVEK